METWQSEHITKNKPDLISYTICNVHILTILESEGILSKNEVHNLRQFASTMDAAEQTSRLYDIISSRVGSYEVLTRALFQSNQTGAAKILMNGFEANRIAQPFWKCKIPIDTNKFLQTNMKFQGRNYGIAEFCDSIDSATLKSILERTLTTEEYFKIFACSDDRTSNLIILKDTVPPQLPFYIPRHLTYNLVDPDMFSQPEPSHLYIFKNIDRTHLSELAYPYSTDVSSNQIFGINVHFILLENDDDLREILAISQHCIYLIRYEKDKNVYILENVWGTSISSKFIYWNYKVSITEEDFLATLDIEQTPVVVICDVPGMGKSVLLANLARQVAEQHLDNIVTYIFLPQFVENLKDTDLKIDNSVHDTLSLLVDYISPTRLGREILIQLMTSGNRIVEFFLDALDELTQVRSIWIQTFVSTLVQTFKHFRFVITSRLHLQDSLETHFCVVSYKIVPFNRKCQESFLSKFWIRNVVPPNNSKIREFTLICLDNVHKFNHESSDICGIPMKLYLLAQILLHNVQKFCSQNTLVSTYFRKIVVPSVFEIYAKYFRLRLGRDITEKDKEVAEKFHTLCGLKLIAPEILCEYEKLYGCKVTTEKLFSYGIVTAVPYENHLILRFVHYTFAEFIVAKFIADIFYSKLSVSDANKNAYNKIINTFILVLLEMNDQDAFTNPVPEVKMPDFFMRTSRNRSLMYFLNGHLRKKKSLENLNSSHSACVNTNVCTQMTPEYLYNLWTCSALHEFPEIVNFVEEILRTQARNEVNHLMNLEYFVSENRWYVLLLVITMYSNNRTSLEKCYNLYREIFKFNMHYHCHKIPIDMLSPLHVILSKGNYNMLEFYLRGWTKSDFPGKGLLHSCVARTLGVTEDNIINRFRVLHYLFTHYKCQINEIWKGCPPILSQNIHLKLLMYLIEQGADTRITDQNGNTIAHNALEYLPSSMYYKLLKCLQLNECTEICKVKNKNGQTPLFIAMSTRSLNISNELLELMAELDA